MEVYSWILVPVGFTLVIPTMPFGERSTSRPTMGIGSRGITYRKQGPVKNGYVLASWGLIPLFAVLC